MECVLFLLLLCSLCFFSGGIWLYRGRFDSAYFEVRGLACYGSGWSFRSLRQTLPPARTKAQVRDQSSPENAQSSIQRNFQIWGVLNSFVLCVPTFLILESWFKTVTLPPGSIWGGDDQDPRFRRVRLRPLFQTRRHWRGSSSSLSNGLGTSQRNLERTPEHCGRRKSKIHQMFSFFLFLLSQASSFSTSIFSLSRQKKKGNFGFVPETSFGPFLDQHSRVQMGNFASVC